ncbi:MAG TPA: TIGR00153 family protein [Longimicrobiales bacterium]|nr:TIGR00153 family protein [Longimicrobiales bacterium]
MRSILGLFAKSPFGPLAQHTERVHETVVLIRPLFEAFIAEDWPQAAVVYEQISRLEHKADNIKNEIRDNLPKSLFLPVDRGDVLTFLREQDALADGAEDLGVLLSMRNTATPEVMREGLLKFVDQVIATSELWYTTCRELPTLQEASFSGPEVTRTIERVKQISDMEWEADKLQAAVTRQVFEQEKEHGAIFVFFWFNVLRVLGGVANHAENSADLLRLMLAKR